MSILVEEVSKFYGEQKALDKVSFEIHVGEIVGFLGPNGAGKSTMMKIITCFIPQSSGVVKVGGFNVEEQALEVRKQIGYLPEHNPLYLDMYVREYLQFAANLYQIKNVKERIDEMIEITGLKVEQNKKIGSLSKGFRQRVGLAQALVHDPKVLILDEPTTGLDPNQLEEIRNLIKKIGKEKTVMLSTHIMQEVEAICDRVIIINKGKIVADNSAKELRNLGSGTQIFTVEFSSEIAQKALLKIEGVLKAEHKGNNVWEIRSENANDVRNNIFKFSVEVNATILTLQKQEQKLEDIFKQLTK